MLARQFASERGLLYVCEYCKDGSYRISVKRLGLVRARESDGLIGFLEASGLAVRLIRVTALC